MIYRGGRALWGSRGLQGFAPREFKHLTLGAQSDPMPELIEMADVVRDNANLSHDQQSPGRLEMLCPRRGPRNEPLNPKEGDTSNDEAHDRDTQGEARRCGIRTKTRTSSTNAS